MDIPSLSINMASAKVQTQAGISVLKMVKENMEVAGAQIVEMIESTAVNTESQINIQV